jgi:hypothetical protein
MPMTTPWTRADTTKPCPGGPADAAPPPPPVDAPPPAPVDPPAPPPAADRAAPPVVRLTDRARASLRDDEMIVFDWAALRVCCGCAGQPWLYAALRPGPSRFRRFHTLNVDPDGIAKAHPLAYRSLAGREILVDCRRRLGLRQFSCDLPRPVGLRSQGRRA